MAADPHTYTRLYETPIQASAESKRAGSFVNYPCTLTALIDLLNWSVLELAH